MDHRYRFASIRHVHSRRLGPPGAPSGGSGLGSSGIPGPLSDSGVHPSLPHPDSPAGRYVDWAGALARIDFVARPKAVRDAIAGAGALVPSELYQATGLELREAIAGILPGLLTLISVLAATTALGAGAGAALGALAFGVGAAPGAAAGAALGLDAGTAILEYLGLAFLAAYVGKSLLSAIQSANHAVSLAWESPDYPAQRHAMVREASRCLASAVAQVFRGVLQGVVAFLLAKGTSAAAARVPELMAKLRASKLNASFAAWVERNWESLVNNPRLRRASVPSGAGTAPTTNGSLLVSKIADSKTNIKPSEVASDPASTVSSSTPPATSFLKTRLPESVLEPGATRGPRPATDNAMPDIPAGFPEISQNAVDTFARTPTPEWLPERTKLYRLIGDDNNPAGEFWTREMPATEADWRSASAVRGTWNGDGGYVTYTVPEGQRMPAWTGPAAPQKAALGGYILKGGGDQVWIPANTVTPTAPQPTPWSVP